MFMTKTAVKFTLSHELSSFLSLSTELHRVVINFHRSISILKAYISRDSS